MPTSPEMQQSASAIGQTFICYARDDEPFVTALAAGLRGRGIPVWLDRWSIEAGADWSRTIDAELDRSENLVIILSPEAVQSNEVLGELRVALDRRKRILPLMYRRCAIPRQLRNLQYYDCTGAPEITAAALDHLARLLRREPRRDAPALTTDRERRIRQAVLDDVMSEAMDRLQRSVITENPVPIRLEQQSDRVDRPWDAKLHLPANRRADAIAIDIVNVFDDPVMQGRVLVLGAPGSGKTTTLLQLMRELANRASRDEAEPLPVLINLTSWKRDQTVGGWLVEELRIKYGVRSDHGARWCDERTLTPLFDGLDELPAEWQQACVDAINEFLSAYRPPHVVVCCRQAEYDNLPGKLQLRGAVRLLPLDDAQIGAYLQASGGSALWSVIRDDSEWMEMARSPLLLSFMTALHDGTDTPQWQDTVSTANHRRRLFDMYLSSFSSDRTGGAYSPEQTLGWLRRLAAMLKRNAQSEFLIERIQPDWLESPLQRWVYRAGVLLIAAVAVSVVVESVLWLTDLVPRGAIGTALRAQMNSSGATAISSATLLSVSLAVGAVIATRRTIVPVETVTWSWHRAQQHMARWSRSGLIGGLNHGSYVGVVGGLVWYLWQFQTSGVRSTWPLIGLYIGAAVGVLTSGTLALVRPSSVLQILANRMGRRRFAEALVGAAIHVIVIGFTVVWVAGFASGLAMMAILGFSGAATDRFRECVLQWMVRGTVIGGVIGALSSPLAVPSVPFMDWWSLWTSGGLTIGTVVGLAIGHRQWITDHRGLVADGEAWAPIRRTWRRRILIDLVVGVFLGVAAVALAWVGYERALRNAALVVVYLHAGFNLPVATTVMAMLAAAITGAMIAAILGAFGGALGGATGLDVERRLAPNQGIRQSAANVVVFAALGVVVIGVPYGLCNVLVGALTVGVLPSAEDWLRLGVGSGMTFGLLAGLLPGAACIQHLVLRLVFWASGALPLRCARFLNFATERRLLQRVGGRYRFIHVLLRDHLAQAEHAGTAARSLTSNRVILGRARNSALRPRSR